jgi:hypothetical protein
MQRIQRIHRKEAKRSRKKYLNAKRDRKNNWESKRSEKGNKNWEMNIDQG